MGYIWKYMKRYPKGILFTFFGSTVFVLVNLGLPTILAQIINVAIVDRDTENLWRWIGLMVLLVFVGLIGSTLLVYATSRLTTLVVRDIRNDMYHRIQKYSHEEYNEIGVPSMITRMTSDAFVIMQFTEMILRFGSTPILMFIGSVTLIFLSAPDLSWIFVVTSPILLVIIYQVIKRSRPLSTKIQVILDRINLYARENLTGLRVIRAFAREEHQEKRFNEANDDYANTAMSLNKLMGAVQPLFSHVLSWITVLVLWFSLAPIERGELQVGTLVAFAEYAFQALLSVIMFSQIFMMAPRAAASARRLEEIMTIPLTIERNEEGVTETETHGYIEFDHVTFAYPDEDVEKPVIHNISFKAEPGETVAFIGSTGSGKSTVIRLIPRFYDITLGRILVDGVDVRDYNLNALRKKIGFVPQKANLFTGTIGENLRYGNPHATDADLDRAVDIAQASDFIQGLETGYDSFLAEGGTNLSGGQKQRLSIARAIVKDPNIYIFDDSFSALDYKTDAELRRRLKEITKDATVLMVAQRVSSIVDAHQIIVLEKGEIAGQGTHEELLATNELYQEIAASQSIEEKEEAL